MMDKQRIKDMLCNAIDNIPEGADIVDCYVEHGFGSNEARIVVVAKTIDNTENSLIEFHGIAHNSFNTDMDNIS